jgi:hypothetical protein
MGIKYKFELIAEQRYEASDPSSNIVHYANFSERWYRNAKLEAAGTDGHDSTRKEIISAASFLETYIFEWARTLAFNRLDEYFPPTPRFQIDPRFKRSLTNKWKQIPAELYAHNIIPMCPKLKLVPLGQLMKYRHRLRYAPARRPMTARISKKKAAVPAFGELESIAHGWALDVAQRLVLDLHHQLGTAPPVYL